jgi:hypothetical protein
MRILPLSFQPMLLGHIPEFDGSKAKRMMDDTATCVDAHVAKRRRELLSSFRSCLAIRRGC